MSSLPTVQNYFNKLHEHSHTGIKITYNTFAQYYYIPFVEKWLSIFIHDCVECQCNKHFNMNIQTAPTQSFSEHAPSFNYRISMDTKGPIDPPSQNKSYIHVIIDAFSHFVVTVPIKSNNAKTAIKTLLHHWIIKFGPPICLVTDRGSEYVNKEMAHLCTLMGIRHSLRTAYSPWTNGHVGVQNRNLGTHLRMFLHDTPKDWAFQVHMYAYAHNAQPLSELNIYPHEIVFHTRPRIPLTFDLNLIRDTSKTCISRYCSQLPEHSHYDKSDPNPFFTEHFQNPFHNGFSLFSVFYPHLRSFMRFSDTTQFQIPQPTKYANSNSSPFNSDKSLSDDDSQTFMTPSTTENSSQTFMTPFSTSNQNTLSITSNHKSLTPNQ